MLNPDGISKEDIVTEESIINILEVKNQSINDDSVEKSSTCINDSTSKNDRNEPVYVNSDVDNTYLKVSINNIVLSEDGIRLSIKLLWNILNDDRQTEDWIGYFKLGLYLFIFGTSSVIIVIINTF